MTADVTITVNKDLLDYSPGRGVQINAVLHEVIIREVNSRALEYAGPDSAVHLIVVRADGPLDRLRQLSMSLAKRYCWQPAQATMFVLCGTVPLISRIRVTTRPLSEPWAAKITLDVDPAESAQAVAAAYTRAIRAQRAARTRPIREKHVRLAVFALVEHADLPWNERVRRWNAQYPQWPYPDANFRRDALDARDRLQRVHPVGGRARPKAG